MEMLALLLLVPIAWPFVAKALYGREITLGELGLNIGIGVLVVLVGYFASRYVAASDTEIINGSVLSKATVPVSCSHSYRCNCRTTYSTDSQGRRTSSESCDTCYEHLRDYDHELNTSVGSITIDRVDRQGVRTPPRFEAAKVGDPVAKTNTFTNYVQAAPNSIFNLAAEKVAHERFKDSIPQYPSSVYDYHYINRILQVGVTVPDAAVWNNKLALMLRSLGPQKQANIILVFAKQNDPTYASALRSAWLGGKKNDIIVVMGVPKYPEIEWTKVVSWTDNELFKIQLASDISNLKVADADAVLDLVNKHTLKQFSRKHFKDFEYLKWEIEPPTWLLIVLFLLSTAVSVIASIKLGNNNTRARA